MSTATLNATEPAAKLAADNDLDLALVTGTGTDGRITQPDVQKYLDANAAPDAADAKPAAAKPAAAKFAPAADVNAMIADGDEPAALDKDAAYYCPGCGKRSDVEGECVGGEFGHAPIAVVPTTELAGDPADFTPAPDTD